MDATATAVFHRYHLVSPIHQLGTSTIAPTVSRIIMSVIVTTTPQAIAITGPHVDMAIDTAGDIVTDTMMTKISE